MSIVRKSAGSSSTTRTVLIESARKRLKTMVAPPPAVSSTVSSPPIASVKPFATASPSPIPFGRPPAPSSPPLKGYEHPASLARRYSRPLVDHADIDPISRGPCLDPHGPADRRPGEGIRHHIGDRSFEQPRVGLHERQRARRRRGRCRRRRSKEPRQQHREPRPEPSAAPTVAGRPPGGGSCRGGWRQGRQAVRLGIDGLAKAAHVLGGEAHLRPTAGSTRPP